MGTEMVVSAAAKTRKFAQHQHMAAITSIRNLQKRIELSIVGELNETSDTMLQRLSDLKACR
jgi:hypothetical protein